MSSVFSTGFLGDLWSYNSNQDVFVVSPEPDVCVFDLDVTRHKSLVLASDGLWNMVRPQECIDIVHRIDKENENLVGLNKVLHFNIEISHFEHGNSRYCKCSVVVIDCQISTE